MPVHRSRRPLYIGVNRARWSRRQRAFAALLVTAALLAALSVPSLVYFRKLSGAMALSDATDLITSAVNEIVLEKMSDPAVNGASFVSFERDNDGKIAAIVTNMAQVNTLSSELLNAVVTASNQGKLNLQIPLGNLLGSNILLGRGPEIPVRITMLTSSHAGFRNELVSAGINQTKHQVMLELYVDVDVLLPWEVLSTQVVSDVLIAETIIVGGVPETYLNWENTNG